MKKISIFILFACLNLGVIAQSVIVIPFFKEGENKRLMIEEDNCYRTFETLIKEAFLKEEKFQLIDYLTIVRKIKRDIIQIPEKDITDRLLLEADPDIYIIADIIKVKEGVEYAIRINFTAHWTHTGKTLAATTLDSGWRNYNDCYSLINKASQNRNMADVPKMEVFIQNMKELIPKDDAQTVSLIFTLDSDTHKYTDKLVNGKLLFQEIQDWVKKHSTDKKADADISSKLLRFSEVAIPITLENGEKYSPSDYGTELLIFLTQHSFADDNEAVEPGFNVKGNTITYTLK